MLVNANDVLGYRIGVDGAPAAVLRDLLIGQDSATVRYLVTDSEAWLATSSVLLAPGVVVGIDRDQQMLQTGLDRALLDRAPGLPRGTPPGREHERRLHDHFGWTPYWDSAGDDPAGGDRDEQLLSARHLIGFYAQAVDGAVGHVEDLIVDLQAWQVRYLEIDTRNWVPGRRVLVAPGWLHAIDRPNRTVALDLSRELVRSSPPYDRKAPLDRSLEENLYRHYGRTGYW